MVHPADYHSRLTVGHRTGSKRRWTYEEKVHVARAEVSLSGSGSFSAKLSLAFPERTFQSISGLRRNPAHRAVVNEIHFEGAARPHLLPLLMPLLVVVGTLVRRLSILLRMAPRCLLAKRRQFGSWLMPVVLTRTHYAPEDLEEIIGLANP